MKDLEEKQAKKLNKKFGDELEETKDHIVQHDRGNAKPADSYCNNFTLIHGCEPGYGVLGKTKLIADVIDLYEKNFDEKG